MPSRIARATVATLSAALALSSCRTPGTWQPRALHSVRMLRKDLTIVRVVERQADLDALTACLSRARSVPGRHLDRWTNWLDLDCRSDGRSTGRRYAYDAPSGEFALLTYQMRPVYRLEGADRACVETLLLPGR